VTKTDSSRQTRTVPHRQVRRIRAGLIALMLLAAGLAAGMLLLKYQLENLRGIVQAEVAARVGAEVRAGAVVVNGMRGLRIDNLDVALPVAGGPAVSLRCPATYLDLDLPDLLAGRVTISRVRMDRALIQVDRPEGAPWIPAGGGGTGAVALPDNLAFRITGSQCRVRLRNVARGSSIDLEEVHFDVARLPDAADLSARIEGLWNAHEDARIEATARFASLEDFDLRLGVGLIRAADVNEVLREPEPFVEAGAIRPRLRATGYPDGNIVVSLDVPVEGLKLRGHPEFLLPVSGSLTALANYDTRARLLTLNSAQAESEQIGGRVGGTVSFAGESPELDLRFEAARIPTDELIDLLLAGRGAEYGAIALSLDGPYAIAVGLSGSTAAPVFSAEAMVSNGRVSLAPADPRLPKADLQFGGLKLSMPPGATVPVGTLGITGGTLEHAQAGLKLQDITGTLVLQDGAVAFEPIQARFAGNTLVGRVRHDLTAATTEFSLEGIVSGLEHTPLGSGIPDVWLAGEVGLRCTGTASAKQVSVDLDVDATRARFDLEWWLRKPIGMGANLKAVNVTLLPDDKITITGAAEIDTNVLNAAVEVRKAGPGWKLHGIRLRSDAIDAVTLGKCFRIPYTASGGALRDATLEWRREGDPEKGRVISIAAGVDELALLADDTTAPLVVKEAEFEVTLDDRDPEKRGGLVVVRAGDAAIPPLNVKWLLPLKAEDPELDALYPPDNRVWRVEAASQRVSLPPWTGSDFACVVVDGNDTTVIERYAATVDGGGTLEGTYRSERPENLATLTAKWTDIPAGYMLRHLELPEVLNGTMSGDFQYTVDEDDPATMAGQGQFAVRDGRFHYDALQAQMGDRMEGATMQLPASLRFALLKAGVRIAGDRVETNELVMEAEGIQVSGGGAFVTSGDLDYQIAVAITPETAQTIPILRNSFNLEGHRLSQSDIQLAFDIQGPLLNPDVKLTGLPGVGDTLVSGAFELGSEAIRVIDLPRQILLDLFKIGGGILGSSRQQRNP
jgi:hypothetical protein